MHAFFFRFSVPVFVVLALFPACSLVVDTDRRQCRTDSDCVAAFDQEALVCREGHCAMSSRWDCRGQTPDRTGLVMLRWVILDAVRRRPLQGTAFLCRREDPECTNEISEIETEPDGLVAFGVDPTFRGFVEIRVPDRVPVLLTIDDPVSYAAAQEVEMVTPEDFEAKVRLAGASTYDPTSSHLLVHSIPCPGHEPIGIRFGTDRTAANTIPFYEMGGLISLSASETDSGGGAGFLNLMPGAHTLTGVEVSSDTSLGEVGYLARDGWITHVVFDPAVALRNGS